MSGRLALLLPRGVAGEQLIDFLDSNLHGLRGGALQVGIERGVDAIASLIGEIGLGEPFEKMVLHHVDEIGAKKPLLTPPETNLSWGILTADSPSAVI